MSALLEFLLGLFTTADISVGAGGCSINNVDIAEETEDRLVLRAGRRRITVFRKYRTIKVNDDRHQPIVKFKSIDLTRHSRGEDGPPYWKIVLRRSWLSVLTIGEHETQVDASMVAAHLSTYTGLPVRAL
jgi:hypothetical protein